VDLGVSRLVSEAPLENELTDITCADRAVGTLEYMAPEQILSSREVRPAADLYALGAILFGAVTGRNVFDGVRGMSLARLKLTIDPPALDSGRSDRVAKGLEEIVSRALARAPSDRYELADEMLADLQLLRDTARNVATNAALKPARFLPCRRLRRAISRNG
jgi:serine/threonine-protein kinase